LSPVPTAYTYLNDKILKVYQAEYEATATTQAPGTFVTDGKNYLKFVAADGLVSVTDVQLEGKKQMDIQQFLRGVKL
jgi:methionyl-tRNA formyltransferase